MVVVEWLTLLELLITKVAGTYHYHRLYRVKPRGRTTRISLICPTAGLDTAGRINNMPVSGIEPQPFSSYQFIH
jgi:hypothetical protein